MLPIKILFSVLLGVLPLSLTYAETAPSYAVVDVKEILDHLHIKKNIDDEMQKKRNMYQKEISRKEESLKALDQSLRMMQGKGQQNTPDYMKKSQTLQAGIQELQKMVEDKTHVLDAAHQKGMERIRAKVEEIGTTLLKKYNIPFILYRENCLSFHKDKVRNLSQEIAEHMNKDSSFKVALFS